MATRTKTKSKESSAASAEKISSAYREYLLTEGKHPSSVFKFCKDIGIREDEFYQFYGSFDALDRGFWKEAFEHTRNRLETDQDFSGFTSREKILTFYFAMMESLKAERSFVLAQMKNWKTPALTPPALKDFKTSFEEWIQKIVAQGKASGDVAARPYLDKGYHHLFWFHFGFILHFWMHDDSANFEKTDAAIEKSVNLAFDLIGKGMLDSAIDFGKFIYQNA